MALIKCPKCGTERDGKIEPVCINCLVEKWQNTKDFIKPKHNPTLLPWSMKTFRSVVTYDFVTNPNLLISSIAHNGAYFFDTRHKNYYCALFQSLGVVSGSAIPPYYPYPKYPLNCLAVVDAFGTPHVIAEDSKKINWMISNGLFIPIAKCGEFGCNNFAEPGMSRCQLHQQ